MKNVPQSERKHIVVIGKRNTGKSSLVNAIIGQNLCIVSDVPGTTTDPVRKSMELLPFGPVVFVDTAGLDDVGTLGNLRIEKTFKEISIADFVLLVVSSEKELDYDEENTITLLIENDIPFLVVLNKYDIGVNENLKKQLEEKNIFYFPVSCTEKLFIEELKEELIKRIPSEEKIPLIEDLIKQGDVIILVVPIDLGAPKGRLILPQVQTIREALDSDAICIVTKERELQSTLRSLNKKPALVVTDSQAIMKVSADVPEDIPLTTFSVMMARYKGELKSFVDSLHIIEKLNDGDKILIAEACTHHAQEDDIGSVKIPRWLRRHTKKNLIFEHSQGIDFPTNLNNFKLIIHCGSCMLTRKAMQARIKQARLQNIPIINYGILISYLHGAFPRVLKPFGINAPIETE